MVQKITILEVLEPFLSRYKESLYLSDISRQLNMPRPTVRKQLIFLVERGVLKAQEKGRLTLYSLNTENLNIVDHITIAEKWRLIKKCEEALVLKELAYAVQGNFEENSRVLIFGSSADSFSEADDIDLLVAGKINKAVIGIFSERFNKRAHIVNVAGLNKVSKALKGEIMKKHLIIKGSEDIIKWLLWQT